MWIEIFRSGEFVSSNGVSETFSEENLQQIAETYNKSIEKSPNEIAPLVKGHPQSDDPAYGWVERLARRGSYLYAKLKQVTPEIIDDVKSGRFKKVSIALYPNLMLRHVGLLGAVPPAVKGLQSPSFNESQEYSEFDNEILIDSSEDIVGENDGGIESHEKNDFTDDNMVPIEEISEKPDYKMLYETALVKEKSNFDEISALNEKYKELKCHNDKLFADLRKKEYRDFVYGLIENPEGAVITPNQAESLVEMMEVAYNKDINDSDHKEFNENIYTQSVNKIKEFATSLNPLFNFKEFAVKQNLPKRSEEFQTRKNISEERLQIHIRAREIQNETPGLSYEEAASVAGKEFSTKNY